MKQSIAFLLSSFLVAGTGFNSAHAQQENTDPVPSAGDAVPTPAEALSESTGDSIRYRASVGLTEYYDDNIFAIPFEEREDFVTLISPSVSAESRWSRHAFALGANADIYRYKEFDNEDAEDARIYGNGRYDLNDTSNFFGGLSWKRGHEDRSSPNRTFGLTPTVFHVGEGFVGYALETEQFTLRLGGTYADYDYDDVPTRDDVVNNDDRDREQTSVGLRAGYKLSDLHEGFVQLSLDDRRYRLDADDNGFNRDSSGYGWAVGIASTGAGFESELLAGYLRQDYDDERFESLGVPDFGLRISTRNKPWRISGYIDRTLEETTLAGASSYLSTRLGINARQPIGPRLTVTATAGFTREDFQDIARTDDIAFLGAGVHYRLTQAWRLQADMDRTERDSNAELSDFSKTRIYLRVVGETGMQPLLVDNGNPVVSSTTEFEGPYLVLAGGRASGSHRLKGFRGPFGDTTRLSAEYGNSAFAGAVIAGYGKMWGRWHLGGEIESQDGGSAWRFEREPARRVIETSLDRKYGAGIRGGYLAAPNFLLFTRLSAIRGEFDNIYRFQDAVADRRVDLDGAEIAIGGEVALATHLNLRMEWLYSNYDSYEIDYGLTDTFSPREYTTRLGLVGTWGGNPDDEPVPETTQPDFGGIYWGTRLGFGVLESEFRGPRGPSSLGTSELSDFAGEGPVWGLFTGVGNAWGRFYAGVEIDLQAESLDWTFTREPDVREVSLRKRWTAGIGPRIGYLIRDNVLLFGRAELVRSEFQIRSMLNSEFDSTERWVSGERFGLGIEVLSGGGMFWSMDYTYAEYDSEEFGIRRADVFQSDDGVFRLGVGYRF